MASTFTPSLNLEIPARGDYPNSWDLPADANYTAIDSGVGGIATVALTSGTVALTQAQANCAILQLTGSLTGAVLIIYPATSSGRKLCINSCTMNGFSIAIRGNGGTDTIGILLTTALTAPVTGFLVLPLRVYWDYGSNAGPGQLASFPSDFIPNGWLPCDGRSIPTAQFDLLFSIIGYSYGGSGANFNVPDYRGYAQVASDNMGSGSAGRFFNLGPGGVTGALSVVPALAPHAHNVSSVDPGHVHPASQAPHNHSGVITGFSVGGTFGAATGWALNTGVTSTAQPAVTINAQTTGIINTASAGAGGASSVVQPSRTVNVYIKW